MAKRPLDLLHNALNQRIRVEIRGGREYRGVLDGYDHPHLNLAMRDAEEVANGQTLHRYPTLIVRGDAIVYINP